MKASKTGKKIGLSNSKQGKGKSGGLVTSAFGKKGALPQEKQGPIDWSIFGLKCKYRGEKQREDIWDLYQSANAHSNSLLLTKTAGSTISPMVLPVAKIQRHPLFVQFFEHIEDENDLCVSRSKARLLMKRFVFDVQELWLSNLQSIKEHDPAQQFHDPMDRNRMSKEEKKAEMMKDGAREDYMRGNGLKNRRDVKAIESVHQSQIQSVSQKRSLQRAYHTARLPNTKVVLDYQPTIETPKLVIDKLLFQAPTIEPLLPDLHMRSRLAHTDGQIGTRVVVHVDRLIPSSSEYHYSLLQPEVLWRFSVFQGAPTVIRKTFVCEESKVASYVASVIVARSASSPNKSTSCLTAPPCVHSSVVYTSSQSSSLKGLSFPWMSFPSLRHVAMNNITISILGFSSPTDLTNDNMDEAQVQAIKVEVVAELDLSSTGDGDGAPLAAPESSPSHIYAELSVTEVKHLMSMAWAPIVSGKAGAGMAWWTDPERSSDLWPRLVDLLLVVEDDSMGEGENEAVPAALTFRADRNSADRVEGALSSQEALSCAHELIELMHVREGNEGGRGGRDFSIHLAAIENSPLHVPGAFLSPIKYVPPEEGSGVDEKAEKDSADIINLLREGLWEEVVYSLNSVRSRMLQGYNLSMVASGALSAVSVVPGACHYGRKGLWFDDQATGKGSNSDTPTSGMEVKEYTQASARFFRNKQVSSSNSVLVNMTFALDTAKLFPCQTAWEDFSHYPIPNPAEEVLPYVPMLSVPPYVLMSEALDSPIDQRPSKSVMVFCTVPVEGQDFPPLDMPSKPDGFQRHVSEKNLYGFREKVEVQLLGVDPVLSTMVFGITRLGAQPNSLNVNPRNIWHNTVSITEHINRCVYRG